MKIIEEYVQLNNGMIVLRGTIDQVFLWKEKEKRADLAKDPFEEFDIRSGIANIQQSIQRYVNACKGYDCIMNDFNSPNEMGTNQEKYDSGEYVTLWAHTISEADQLWDM